MTDESDIVKELREAERLEWLQSQVQSNYKELEMVEGPSEDVPDETIDVVENTVGKIGGNNTPGKEYSKSMKELLEIIQFTESVSTRIHGVLDEAEIYRLVVEGFKKSEKYSAHIFLLSGDGSELSIVTSIKSGKIWIAEKLTGLKKEGFKIPLSKAKTYRLVIKEGITLHVKVSDMLNEMFSRSVAYIIGKATGNIGKFDIITPLKMQGKTIGIFGISSTSLVEDFIPSVKNLAKHISTALELAKETTERKRVQEELKMRADELIAMNQELTAMNEDLVAAQELLRKRTAEFEALLKQKDEFIHMLGHDLKNPLTPLLTLLPLVEKKLEDPELQKMIQVIIRSTKNIKELITETLQLARLDDMEEIKLDDDIRLHDEVETVIKNNRVLLDDNDIIVENKIDVNIVVEVDKLQLGELIGNFITNAVKYTPDDTNGIVTINAKAENDDVVEVSVKDTGCGLTDEQKVRVFDKFYKMEESARRGMESSGLGLAICKTIVEKHGGHIWVESSGHGKGSTFYFTLKAGERL